MNSCELGVVKEIANRMRTPDQVKSIVLHPDNQKILELYRVPLTYLWDDLSIANGFPGILLMFAELDRLFPEEKWDVVVNDYVIKIKESLEVEMNNSISIFEGIAGINFALMSASRHGTRYRKLINTIDNYLILKFNELHNFLKQKVENFINDRVSFAYYELMSGIIGVGIYALQHIDRNIFSKVLEDILHLTISMTKLIEVEKKDGPRVVHSFKSLIGKRKSKLP